MDRKRIFKIPPRPEVIRSRYALFLASQSDFIAKYKERFLTRMNHRFGLDMQSEKEDLQTDRSLKNR